MQSKVMDELVCDGFTKEEANRAFMMSIAEDTSSSNFDPSYVYILTHSCTIAMIDSNK